MRRLRAVLAGLALSLGPAWADTNTAPMTPDALRAAAAISVAQGRDAQALRLADALLLRDPDDVDALVSRSRALRNLGRFQPAQDTARRAFRAASDDLQRYAAAMAMAQALSSDGKRTRAQIWLRRAAHHAPSEAAAATAARDYRYVARRNPWQVKLAFGIAPTDNVNNGSRHDSMLLDLGDTTLEVPFNANAMPLSGTEISAGASVTRRLSETETHSLTGRLSLDARTYQLSAEARRAAPTADGDDYAFVRLGAGLRLLTGPSEMPLEWRAGMERARYGGAPYADTLRFGVARTFRLTQGAARIGLSAERLHRHDIDEHATGLEVSAQFLRPLSSGGQLGFSLGREINRSDSSVLDNRVTRAGLTYALPDTVLGTELTLDMGVRWLDHDAYPTSADGRQDIGGTLGATAVLQEVTLYGFHPTVRVEHRVTDSTLRRNDTAETSLSLGFRSAF